MSATVMLRSLERLRKMLDAEREAYVCNEMDCLIKHIRYTSPTRQTSINPGIFDGTRIRIEVDDKFIRVKTLSRRYVRVKEFLIFRDRFSAWLDQGEAEFFDQDYPCFLYATKGGGEVHLRISWLNTNENELSGYREYVSLPELSLREMLDQEEAVRHFLHYEKRKPAKVDFSHVQKRLAECVQDKQVRRALSKALRSFCAFRTTTMYTDFVPHSFFFREEKGVCGGLILHKSTVKTNKGEFPKLYYGMHT